MDEDQLLGQLVECRPDLAGQLKPPVLNDKIIQTGDRYQPIACLSTFLALPIEAAEFRQRDMLGPVCLLGRDAPLLGGARLRANVSPCGAAPDQTSKLNLIP